MQHRPTAKPPLAHPRAVRLVVAAAGASYVGDEICAVALAIAVHDAGGSGLAVAAVVLATLLPRVVLAPVIGWLIDHVETTRLLAWVSLAQCGLTVALSAASGLAVQLGLLLLISAGTALTPSALMALVPTVAGSSRSSGITSTMSTVSRASAVLGPLAGAVLVSVSGVRGALLVDAATFLAFAAGFAALGVRRMPQPRGACTEGANPALDGIRTLWRDRVLRRVVSVLACAIVFVGITYVATVFLAKDVMHAGNAGVGLLTAAYGGGMTLGCLGCRRVARERLAPLATTAPVVIGGGFLLTAAVPVLGVAVPAYLMSGIACGLALTAMRTLVVARVPDGLLGRVFAAAAAIGASGELLALCLGGVLLSATGARVALLVAGVGAILPVLAVVAVAGVRRRTVPRVPDVHPVAAPIAVSEPVAVRERVPAAPALG